MKALLIIDMQKGSFKPYSVRHDSLGTIERINFLSNTFRKKKYPVIFIQHDGSKERCFIPGSDDWKILPELIKEDDDLTVSKTANDSFYSTGLNDLIKGLKIEELYITGCATDFCVDTTIKSSLSKNYKVIVIEDGHTTASRPHIDAVTIINYFNWLWAEMTATKYKIEVVKAENINL